MRHKDKAILYWFRPPEIKTLRPILQFVLLAWRDYMATCPREDALARLILGDKQGRWTGVQVGYDRETYPLVCLHHVKLIRASLICLDRLVLHVKLSSRLGNLLEGLQEVVWAAN
jgi:hypothetical protein